MKNKTYTIDKNNNLENINSNTFNQVLIKVIEEVKTLTNNIQSNEK